MISLIFASITHQDDFSAINWGRDRFYGDGPFVATKTGEDSYIAFLATGSIWKRPSRRQENEVQTSQHAVLLKVRQGRIEWSLPLGQPGQPCSQVYSLVVDRQGSVYFGGEKYTGEDNRGDALIGKVSATGKLLWERTFDFGGSSYQKGGSLDPNLSRMDYVSHVNVVGSNGVVAAVWADYGSRGPGRGLGAALIRLDQSGRLIWRKEFRPSSYFGTTASRVFGLESGTVIANLYTPNADSSQNVVWTTLDGGGKAVASISRPTFATSDLRSGAAGGAMFLPVDMVPVGKGYFALLRPWYGGLRERDVYEAVWLDGKLKTERKEVLFTVEGIPWRRNPFQMEVHLPQPDVAISVSGSLAAIADMSAPGPSRGRWRAWTYSSSSSSSSSTRVHLEDEVPMALLRGTRPNVCAPANSSPLIVARPKDGSGKFVIIDFWTNGDSPAVIMF